MAQDDSQAVTLGMLKDLLATQSAQHAAQTVTLQNQLEKLQADNASLTAAVEAAKVTGSALDDAEVRTFLREKRAKEDYLKKIQPFSDEYTAIEKCAPAGFSTTPPAVRNQARAMCLVQAEQSLLKLKVAHDRYEAVHTAYAAEKAQAASPAEKALVATEFQPRFVEARQELSAAFNRGIAVSQTRRRLYGVLRLEPHLRRYLGDFDDEALLLSKPQTKESFEEYIDAQRKAHEAHTAATQAPPKGGPKGLGNKSTQQTANKQRTLAIASAEAAAAEKTAHGRAARKRKADAQRAAAKKAKADADAAAAAGTVDGPSASE